MIPFFPEPFSPLSGGRVSGKTSIFISISIYIALSICVSVCIYICTCISISIGDQSLRLVTFGHQWFLCFLSLSISLSLSVFLSVSISIPLSLSAPSGPIGFLQLGLFFWLGRFFVSSPVVSIPSSGERRKAPSGTSQGPFFLAKGALLQNIPQGYFAIHPPKMRPTEREFRPLRWATRAPRPGPRQAEPGRNPRLQ